LVGQAEPSVGSKRGQVESLLSVLAMGAGALPPLDEHPTASQKLAAVAKH